MLAGAGPESAISTGRNWSAGQARIVAVADPLEDRIGEHDREAGARMLVQGRSQVRAAGQLAHLGHRPAAEAIGRQRGHALVKSDPEPDRAAAAGRHVELGEGRGQSFHQGGHDARLVDPDGQQADLLAVLRGAVQ